MCSIERVEFDLSTNPYWLLLIILFILQYNSLVNEIID